MDVILNQDRQHLSPSRAISTEDEAPVVDALKKRDVKAVAKELQSSFNNKLQADAPIKSEDQRCPPSRVLPKMLASNLACLQRSAPIVARSPAPLLPSYL